MNLRTFATRIIAIIAVTAIFGIKSNEINAGDTPSRIAATAITIDTH